MNQTNEEFIAEVAALRQRQLAGVRGQLNVLSEAKRQEDERKAKLAAERAERIGKLTALLDLLQVLGVPQYLMKAEHPEPAPVRAFVETSEVGGHPKLVVAWNTCPRHHIAMYAGYTPEGCGDTAGYWVKAMSSHFPWAVEGKCLDMVQVAEALLAMLQPNIHPDMGGVL